MHFTDCRLRITFVPSFPSSEVSSKIFSLVSPPTLPSSEFIDVDAATKVGSSTSSSTEVRHSAGDTDLNHDADVLCSTPSLSFSFVYEIHTMVLPTIEITDYYATIYDKSFRKTSLLLLLFLRWMPQFLVYCIDMTIWFAVWQAFAGLCVGFSDHLGDIRSMKDIRNNLGRAPEYFCAKILSIDAGSRRGSSDSILNSAEHNSMECRRQCLMYPNSNDGETRLRSDPHKLQGYVDRLGLEVTLTSCRAMWTDLA